MFACAKSTTENTLQTLPFAVHGSVEAMPDFQKGFLLLHNFEYDDARQLFLDAQRKDPLFVMAYWGEAMTYDHPIWREVDVDKARAALNKFGTTKEERSKACKSELERDLLAAVEILFGDGSKPDREKQYSEFMKNLYERYPDNNEVSAFYALSLLQTKKTWGEWEPQNDEAAKICEKILSRNSNHPGALHYLVHADDHPQYANKGLSAANKYSKVASYAGHALHMPSHIYLALGMWNDVVTSNEVSWQAGVDRKIKKGLSNEAYNYHAHLWLEYGYLQQGRFEKAKKLLEDQIRYSNELSSIRARSGLVQMKGHYLFETNEWSSPISTLKIETGDLDFATRFNDFLTIAAHAFHIDDQSTLQEIINEYKRSIASIRPQVMEGEKITICSTTRYQKSPATKSDLIRAERYLAECTALLAWLNKDLKTAEENFKKALPQNEVFVVGPPDFFKSPYEFYGDFLLSVKRPAEAYENYQKALIYSPKRLMSIKGSLNAALAMNDQSKISSLQKQITAMTEVSIANNR